MFSLTMLTVLVVIFGYLALRHWKTTIGAGPTILIIGAIVISAFGASKWVDYQQRLREFDQCVGRVDRSLVSSVFNSTLVNVIVREIPDRPDIAEELRSVLPEPLTLADCPAEPTFWESF